MKEQKISIEMIRMDGGTQSRAALNPSTIEEYAESIEAGQELPAVILFHDGEAYWLADGFHRVASARKAGKKTVSAEVRQGTRREAILHSVGANANHGLRRTNADKRRAVENLLADAEWKTWSDREIAKQCAVSHGFVASLRPQQHSVLTGNVTSETPKTPRKYDTRHGTTAVMDTARIGKADQPAPVRNAAPYESKGGNGRSAHREPAKAAENKFNFTDPTPADTGPAPTPSDPWAELEAEFEVIFSAIRKISGSIATACDFDPATKRARRKFAYQISHAGTIDVLSQIIRNVKENLPAELCEKPPGFVTRYAAKLHDQVKKSR